MVGKAECPFCKQPIPPEKMKELEKKYTEAIQKESDKKRTEEIHEINEKHKEELEGLSLKIKEKMNEELRKEYQKLYEPLLDQRNHTIAKMQLDINELQRSSERKTPNELGDEGQESLLAYLREEFPNDQFTETQKGKEGADIFHKIMYKNQRCGLIIYEVKNVTKWKNRFIEQANKEKTIHGTQHVILVTNVFPASENNICEREGIMVVSQSKAKYIAGFIRRYILDLHKMGLSQDEIGIKTDRLYQYLNSEGFKQEIGAHFRSVKNLRDLQDKEMRTHKQNWSKQHKEFENLHNHISNIDGEIISIVEEKIPLVTVIPVIKKKKKKIIAELDN